MRRFSVATAEPEVEILNEERIRDQLSVAEELLYVGHREPALVATGAALEGAIRLAGGPIAGYGASAGALLEGLLAHGAISDEEYQQLFQALSARDHVIHGYAPEDAGVADAAPLGSVLQIAIRLLEPSPAGHAGQREN